MKDLFRHTGKLKVVGGREFSPYYPTIRQTHYRKVR